MKEIVKHHKNVPLIFDERLVERADGDLEGSPAMVDGVDIEEKRWDLNVFFEDGWGETVEHSYARIKDFLEEICEKNKNKNVLVVAHSGVGMLFKCYFKGFPEDGKIFKYHMENCEIAIFKD